MQIPPFFDRFITKHLICDQVYGGNCLDKKKNPEQQFFQIRNRDGSLTIQSELAGDDTEDYYTSLCVTSESSGDVYLAECDLAEEAQKFNFVPEPSPSIFDTGMETIPVQYGKFVRAGFCLELDASAVSSNSTSDDDAEIPGMLKVCSSPHFLLSKL